MMSLNHLILSILLVMTSLQAEVLRIASDTRYDATKYAYYLIDKDHLDIHDVIKTRQWKKIKSGTLSFSSLPAPVWIRLSLSSETKQRRLLHIDTEYLYSGEVYVLKDKEITAHHSLGIKLPFDVRTIDAAQMLFPIELSDQKRDVYMRLQGLPGLSVSFDLLSEDQAIASLEKHTLIKGVFIGILLFLLLYNLVIYGITRFRPYLPYLSYIFGLSLYFLIIDDYLLHDLWPFSAGSYFIVLQTSIFIIYASMILFAKDLLELSRHYPASNRLLTSIVWLLAVSETALLFAEQRGDLRLYVWLNSVESFVVIASLSIILLLAYRMARKGDRTALFYSIAWTIMFAGLLNYVLQLTLLDGDQLTAQMYARLSIVIEGLLFSFILAFRIRELDRDRKSQEARLMQQEHHAQMGKMLTDIAHQWRQPLHSINAIMFEQSMRPDMPSKAEWKKGLHDIETLTHYLSKTIDDFQGYYLQDDEKITFTIADSVKSALNIVSSQLERKEVHYSLRIPSSLQTTGRAAQYLQVVLIILNNTIDAFDAPQDDKRIILTGEQETKTITLSICDNAGGVALQDPEKIFDLYFTTKKKGTHMGMGLFMARELMQKHLNGSLTLYNSEKGACLVLRSPRA